MITGMLGAIREPHLAVGVDHEDASLLPWITLCACLAEAAAIGRYCAPDRPQVEARPHGLNQFERGIRITARVGEDDARVTGLVAEPGDEAGGTVPHQYEVGARSADEGLVALQLHRLLSAEQSTEVAHEREHGWRVAPEIG
jgi:hypothetical protein